MAVDYVTNQEIIMAARQNLPQNVWHYLTGGAESETTMRRNRRTGQPRLSTAGARRCF